MARRADELGEVLGEDHDLAVLGELARRCGRGAGAAPRLGRRPRKALLKAIAKRRRKLRRRALKDGKRLYGDPTRRFVRSTEKTFARAAAAAAAPPQLRHS
jgi:hypothetical protein